MWVYITEKILYIPAEFSAVGIVFITPLLTFIILKYWVFTESPDINQRTKSTLISNTFGNYKQLSYYLIFSFLVFYLAHGKGVIVNWFNPDDWANRAGHVWIGSEGRWLSDIIYKHLYKFRPNNLYQFFVAGSLYAITPILVLHTLKTKFNKPPLYYFLFSALVLHPYQVDILNFDITIALYPIALVFSLMAGILSVRNKQTLSSTVSAILLVFLSIGIYQTIIFFILVPFSLNVFNKETNIREIFHQFLKVIFITISGVFLYFITSKYYTSSIIKVTSQRLKFDVFNIQHTFDSIIDLPSQFITHTLALHPIVHDAYSYYMAGIFFIVLLLLIFITIKSITNNQFKAFSTLIIPLIIINLPIYLFQVILATLEINAPGRIMYLNNLNLSLSIILIIKYYFDQKYLTINKKYIFSFSTMALLFCLIGIYTANLIWNNQKKSYDFDISLTNNIYQQIKLHVTNKITIEQTKVTFYGALAPKTAVAERFLSVGKTSYSNGAFKYIFESLYNLTPQYNNNTTKQSVLCTHSTPKLTVIKKADSLLVCL